MDANFPKNQQAGASRVGFHYHPDSLHYRETDLQAWLPTLAATGASWLVLNTDGCKAIPEPFIRGLLDAAVQPVLHFQLPLDPAPSLHDVQALVDLYAKWGARYAIFFNRPNASETWPACGWAQQDLVERFLDRFIPLADAAQQAGMTPVFPPLEPGGSYWDTAFLRTSLTILLRRKQDGLAANLAIAAYAWTHGHGLDWGAGGPERWPLARPYSTPESTQDQKGVRIYDWYQAAAKAALGSERPMLLLQAGAPGGKESGGAAETPVENLVEIARLLMDEPEDDEAEAAGEHVLTAAFNLPDLPHTENFAQATAVLHELCEGAASRAAASSNPKAAHPIQHYILLPTYDWGISDWHLDAIRPYLRKYRPVVGFNLAEACLANKVTVIGNETEISEDAVIRLRHSGCKVERIDANGTSLATILAER
jgi:hypothetical protein